MAKKPPNVPADKLALYDAIVATLPDVERKGAANPYTSRNGHMFSFIDKDGVMSLRLPKDALEAFRAEHKTGPSLQYGAVMREYVVVPGELLADLEKMRKYFQQSYTYIGTLKPKLAKRKL